MGAPLLSGTASFGDGAFSVSGAGANPLGTADQLMFVYRELAGDGEITARVASLSGIQINAEAGVTIRESLAAGSKHAFVRLSGAGTVAMKSRSITNGNQAGTSEAGSGAPVWLRLERSGSTLNAFRSADGVSWMPIGTVAIPMSPSVYVGLGVTSGTAATRVTAGFDNVNLSPTISLAAPADGATYTAPATITVSATASDGDGTVTTVEFYAGATLIGTDTTSPYSVTLDNVAAGSYALTAVARDDDSATTTSAARNITVTAPANQPPSVSLTSPANGATFTAPATITLLATAIDADGTIATVEFYRGGTIQLGTDATSPYGVTWSNVPAGSYQLTAVARDNASGMTVSSTITITVNDPAAPSRAVFNASADHNTNVDYYVVEIFPAGADPESANAVAAQNIGKPPMVGGECEADVRAMIQSLSPGSYVATVTAFNANGSTRSVASAPFTR